MENISLYLRVLFLKTTLKSYFFKSKDTLKEIIWSYRLHPPSVRQGLLIIQDSYENLLLLNIPGERDSSTFVNNFS